MLEKIQKFSSKEVELEYLLTGENHKETILFVHGAGTNLRQFINQHLFFSSKYKVLSVSLRGHGYSSCASVCDAEQYTLSKNCEDIVELLQYLHIPNVHYVGNSAGGLIGLELIKKYPERVSSLVTFGTTAELSFSRFTANLIVVINRTMFKLNPNGHAKFLAKNSTNVKEVQQQLVDHFLLSKNASHYLQKNIGNYSYTDVIEKMNIPYLLIKGENDKEINKNLDTTLQAIEKNDKAHVIELEEAGHIANLDRPNQFNEIVSHFISSWKKDGSSSVFK